MLTSIFGSRGAQVPRGDNYLRVTDAQVNEIFQRNHGRCPEARAYDASAGADRSDVWATFRDLTARRYPTTARKSGAE